MDAMENVETKNCPFCAEEINIEAIKCKHCGEMLNKNNLFESLDIPSLVFGILMFILFFTPWVHWTFISVSGYEIPNYLTNLDSMFGKSDSTEPFAIIIYALFYSIPLFSLMSVFIALLKKKTSAFSTLAGAVFLLIFLFFRYILKDNEFNIEIFNILGVGGYLSLLLSICMIGYGLVRIFNNIRYSIYEKTISTSLKFSFIAFVILAAVFIIFIIRAYKNFDSEQGYNVSPVAVENYSQVQREYEAEVAAENKEFIKRNEQELKNFISKDKTGENFGDFIKKFSADKNFQLSRIKFPIIVYGEMISPEDIGSYHSDEYFKDTPMGWEEGDEYEYYLKKKLTKDNWDRLDSRYFKPSTAVNIDGSDYLCSFDIYSEHNVAFHIGSVGPSCWDGVQYKFNKIDGEWYFVGF